MKRITRFTTLAIVIASCFCAHADEVVKHNAVVKIYEKGKKLADPGPPLKLEKVGQDGNNDGIFTISLADAAAVGRGKYMSVSEDNLDLSDRPEQWILQEKPGGWLIKWKDNPLMMTMTREDTVSGKRVIKLKNNEEAENQLWQITAAAALTNSIGMEFNLIPAGKFMMGSPKSEENRPSGFRRDNEQQHEVTITRDYSIGITEVTQSQWKKVMKTTPWTAMGCLTVEGDDNPAACITWNQAVEFCGKLSKQEGRTYRLPTEAEWKYACRAGSKTAYCFGDKVESLGEYAWYWNGNNSIQRVGQKKPNAWGLYDMHGNVCEWCADTNRVYPKEAVTDPVGPVPAEGSDRMARGGSGVNEAWHCRAAYRLPAEGTYCGGDYGFRVALSSPTLGESREMATAKELPADQKLAVPPGPLTRGKRYLTADGSRFLMFADDGNVVVASVADDKYLWGLNARAGVDYRASASVHVTNEGRFEVRDAGGSVIWATPDKPIPGSVLDLTKMGVPRMTKPGPKVESYSLPLSPGTTIQPGEKYGSTDGKYYLLHAGYDNNLMMVRTADDGVVWGLNEQSGVNYLQAAVVRFNDAGILEVLDGAGKVIYQMDIGKPGARLGLDATGKFTAQ